MYIARSTCFQDHFSYKAIIDRLEHMGKLAPIGFMAMIVLTVVSPLPSLLLDIVSGIFFGPYLGTLYSAFGALAGSIVSFMVARLLGRSRENNRRCSSSCHVT